MHCIKIILALLLRAIMQSTAAPTLPSNYHYDLSERFRRETSPGPPWLEDTPTISPASGSRIKLWKRLSPSPPERTFVLSQSLRLGSPSSGTAGSAASEAVPKTTWRQTIHEAYTKFREKFITTGQKGEKKGLGGSIAKLAGAEGGTKQHIRQFLGLFKTMA